MRIWLKNTMNDIKRTRALSMPLKGEPDEKNQKFDVSELPSFDTEAYLDSEEEIAAFLTDIIDANDASLLASALGDIARARGMAETSMHSEKRGADGRYE